MRFKKTAIVTSALALAAGISIPSAGSDSGADWTDPTFGDSYDIWVGFGNNTVSLVRHGNATSGSVDLKALLTFLHANYGIVTGIEQVNFGFEVRSTSGASEDFTVTHNTYDAS